MLKCLRFNWRLDFSPSPFEQGVWKKHYIQMVKKLHVTKPKVRLGESTAHSRTSAVIQSGTRNKWSNLKLRVGDSSEGVSFHYNSKMLLLWGTKALLQMPMLTESPPLPPSAHGDLCLSWPLTSVPLAQIRSDLGTLSNVQYLWPVAIIFYVTNSHFSVILQGEVEFVFNFYLFIS